MPLSKEERTDRAITHASMLSLTIVWGIMFSLAAIGFYLLMGYLPVDMFWALMFVSGFGIVTVLVESISSWGPYDGI